MSYINDALRKAQRERDGRYERFGGIIAPGPDGPEQPRKRRLAIGAAIMLFVLIPAGLLLAVYVLHQPSSRDQGSSQAGRRGKPRSASVRDPQAARKRLRTRSGGGSGRSAGERRRSRRRFRRTGRRDAGPARGGGSVSGGPDRPAQGGSQAGGGPLSEGPGARSRPCPGLEQPRGHLHGAEEAGKGDCAFQPGHRAEEEIMSIRITTWPVSTPRRTRSTRVSGI